MAGDNAKLNIKLICYKEVSTMFLFPTTIIMNDDHSSVTGKIWIRNCVQTTEKG